jgi:PAS domain S-box-containing protein
MVILPDGGHISVIPMLFRIVLIISLSLLGIDTFAQEINKSAVKAEITVRLINHITWKDENKIQAFNIGFIGIDQEYFNYLERSITAHKIRGKQITLTKLENIEQLTNIQMLIVAPQTKQPFTEIAIKARQTNTLIVSEVDDEQIYIMINFYLTPDNNLRFELNRSNLLLEQLKVSNDILLSGGTELDVAELYRKMESKLHQLTSVHQQSLLYVALVILSLFLLLVFRLYKLNQEKKRVTLELAKSREHLEEEVKDRTAAARESETHYRALSELSPVGVFKTDINGNCLYVNKRWCEFSGLTREQAVGYCWLDAIHPIDRSQLSKNWTDNIQSEKILNTEHRYITPAGVIRWVFGQCDAEYDTDGILKGYIGAVVDITEQRKLEEQLSRTQKMDALGKLTGGIAHDYNNMLGIILGYSELITKVVHGQPKLTKYINEIIYAAERGAKLTKKLLTFARQQSAESKVVNLNTLLEDSQLMLEKTLTVRVRLIYVLEKSLWLINIDHSDLEDAILNMSINAMHAIEGNGKLTFETRNEAIKEIDAQHLQISPGDYVLLSITDTGCGMDDATKENIFDPFFSTKGEFGTGLGLSQVYGFAQRSKGNVKIYSELGHGSRFTLYFPRYYESGIEKKEIKEVKETNLSGNQTILVVDDEPALAELASEVLIEQGYQVLVANNGKEALVILEKEAVDVLVSDVIMPEMNGYELATIVQEKYPSIKIQLASGFNDTIDADNVSSLLQEQLLHKPYHSEKLLLRIRELLNGSAD